MLDPKIPNTTNPTSVNISIIRGDIFSKRLSSLLLLFYNFFITPECLIMAFQNIRADFKMLCPPPPLPLNLTASVELYIIQK